MCVHGPCDSAGRLVIPGVLQNGRCWPAATWTTQTHDMQPSHLLCRSCPASRWDSDILLDKPALRGFRCTMIRRGMRVQAQSIEQGTSDATGRALLHRHLTFHYMVDADMLAVLTCVAEWEAGFVEDVLPCFKYSGAPLPLAVRRRRLRAARSQV